MKKFIKISYTFLALLLLFLPFLLISVAPQARAAQQEYTPLIPIQGLTRGDCDTSKSTADQISDTNCKADLGGYIPGLVRLAIQVAGALAVIMIVIGGVQYASSDAISGKSEGKERIQNAIYGLLLAIGAYIILYSVNPKTLSLQLTIAPPTVQTVPPQATTSPVVPNPLSPGDLAGMPWPAAWPGGALPSDSSVRATLAGFPISISVNRPSNCATVGEPSCTSLDGLSQRAINGLRALSSGCRNTFSCGGNSAVTIRVTGGTEFWNHGLSSAVRTNPSQNPTLHKPGMGAIDLSKNGPLDSYIQSFPAVSGRNGCATGPAYSVNGVVYVNESGGAPHWHVCY